MNKFKKFAIRLLTVLLIVSFISLAFWYVSVKINGINNTTISNQIKTK